jgi:hypothetical protein
LCLSLGLKKLEDFTVSEGHEHPLFTIREGLGSFFLVAISIVSGGIYLHFLSWCNDEEEQ